MVRIDYGAQRRKISGENMDRFRAQVREVINRNTVVSLALEKGYNAYLPVYDGGVDFILYRESDGASLNVQLKSRWTIAKKYERRKISIAFPMDGIWYLVPHNEMIAHANEVGITQTASWVEKGLYSMSKPSAETIKRYAEYRFANIAEVAAEATDEAETSPE